MERGGHPAMRRHQRRRGLGAHGIAARSRPAAARGGPQPGIRQSGGPLPSVFETSRAGFLLAQDVSAYSLVAVARATAPVMTEGGSISTLTYLGSTRVMPNYNVMGVAKASLEASMRYLASDLGPAEDPRERHFRGAGEDRFGPRRKGFLHHSRQLR